MFSSLNNALRGIIDIALVVIALGVVLQILFPKALVFIEANVTGNLINLISQFSGAGLIGAIAAGIVVWLINRR
tara:strand:- start:146 stop:367 length:222 start_codon:yes stop_codon:yes gene_type:complete